jgi:hypothetical protein
MKKIKLSSLRVDLKKERGGDWVKSQAFTSDDGPVSYLLRSTNYPPYAAAVRKAARAMAQAMRDGKDIDDDVAFAEEGRRVCDHLLLGWGNLDVEYSPEEALRCLTDPSYRPLLSDVMACADRVGQSVMETVEDDAKN